MSTHRSLFAFALLVAACGGEPIAVDEDGRTAGALAAPTSGTVTPVVVGGGTLTPGCWSDANCSSTQYCARSSCGAATGTCTALPNGCARNTITWSPTNPYPGGAAQYYVCGCNGQTYANACAAILAGTTVAAAGPCPGDACDRNADCADTDFCVRPLCANHGFCAPRPVSCDSDGGGDDTVDAGNIFTTISPYSQACGCNGVLYSSQCAANRHGVNVAHFGLPCP